jgi:hypothetical protein
MEIKLLEDWTDPDSGAHYEEGSFLKVAKSLADQLIADGLAEVRNPDEAVDAEVERRKAGIEAERERRRRESLPIVEVGRDRLSLDPTGGFRGLGEFASHVAHACMKGGAESRKLGRWARVTKADEVVEYSDAQGGYLIPPQYADALMQTRLEAAIVRPRRSCNTARRWRSR